MEEEGKRPIWADAEPLTAKEVPPAEGWRPSQKVPELPAEAVNPIWADAEPLTAKDVPAAEGWRSSAPTPESPGLLGQVPIGVKLGMKNAAVTAARAFDPGSVLSGLGIDPNSPENRESLANAPATREERTKVAEKGMTEAMFPHGVPEAKGLGEQVVRGLSESWPTLAALALTGGLGPGPVLKERPAPAMKYGVEVAPGLISKTAQTIGSAAIPFGIMGATDEDPAAGALKGGVLGATLGGMHLATKGIEKPFYQWLAKVGGGATIGGGATAIQGGGVTDISRDAIIFGLFEALGMPETKDRNPNKIVDPLTGRRVFAASPYPGVDLKARISSLQGVVPGETLKTLMEAPTDSPQFVGAVEDVAKAVKPKPKATPEEAPVAPPEAQAPPPEITSAPPEAPPGAPPEAPVAPEEAPTFEVKKLGPKRYAITGTDMEFSTEDAANRMLPNVIKAAEAPEGPPRTPAPADLLPTAELLDGMTEAEMKAWAKDLAAKGVQPTDFSLKPKQEGGTLEDQILARMMELRKPEEAPRVPGSPPMQAGMASEALGAQNLGAQKPTIPVKEPEKPPTPTPPEGENVAPAASQEVVSEAKPPRTYEEDGWIKIAGDKLDRVFATQEEADAAVAKMDAAAAKTKPFTEMLTGRKPEPAAEPKPRTADELADAVENFNEPPERSGRTPGLDKLMVELGQTAVPGLRMSDAPEAANMYLALKRGELTPETWDAYVEELKAQNRVKGYKPPEPPVQPVSDAGSATEVAATPPEPKPSVVPEGVRAFMGRFGWAGKTRKPTGLLTEGLAPGVDPEATGFQPASKEPGSLPTYSRFPLEKLELAPKVFQHKRAADLETGVSAGGGSLAESPYNEADAGHLEAFETKDGKFLLAHGHNRHWAAKRDGINTVKIQVYREVDGWTPEAVKMAAFKRNVTDGRLDALDIAQFLREIGGSEADLKGNINLRTREAQNGIGLTALSQRIWEDVYEGRWGRYGDDQAADKGAALGGPLRDNPAAQEAIYKRLMELQSEGKEYSPAAIRNMAEAGRLSAVTQKSQGGLWGENEADVSLVVERGVLTDYLKTNLTTEKNSLLAANRHQARLEAAGNVIKPEENKRIAAEAKEVLGGFGKFKDIGGSETDNFLNRFAEELSNAKSQGEENAIKQRAVAEIYSALAADREGFTGKRSAAVRPESPEGGGRPAGEAVPAEEPGNAAEVDTKTPSMFSLKEKGDKPFIQKLIENKPDQDEINRAIENTPGASLAEGGLGLTVTRFQQPDQAGERSVRTGVFYLPEAKSPYARHYKNATHGYGGPERFEGETVYQRPVFVKAGTGGRAPHIAYDAMEGKGAYERMRKDVLQQIAPDVLSWDQIKDRGDLWKIPKIEALLRKYDGNVNMAHEILLNSPKGNQLPYAIQEHIVAARIRKEGYDSVISYSKHKGAERLAEVFDVREEAYPWEQQWANKYEEFYEGKPLPATLYSVKENGQLGLFGGERPLTKFEQRLNGIVSEYPDADPERVAAAMRATPKASDREIAGMAKMAPEEAGKVVKGTMTAMERAELAKRQGGVTPGLFGEPAPGGPGGLFAEPNAAPAPERSFSGIAGAREPKAPAPERESKIGEIYDRQVAQAEKNRADFLKTPKGKQEVLDNPWEVDADAYQRASGVHAPWIAEISPHQYASLGIRQKAAYDAKRSREWQASADIKTEWRDKVIEAYKAGEISLDDRSIEISDAARLAILNYEKGRSDEVAKAAKKEAYEARVIRNPSDVAVGDKIDSPMYGKDLEVVKVNPKSITVEGKFGKVKIEIRGGKPVTALRPEEKPASTPKLAYDKGEPWATGEAYDKLPQYGVYEFDLGGKPSYAVKGSEPVNFKDKDLAQRFNGKEMFFGDRETAEKYAAGAKAEAGAKGEGKTKEEISDAYLRATKPEFMAELDKLKEIDLEAKRQEPSYKDLQTMAKEYESLQNQGFDLREENVDLQKQLNKLGNLSGVNRSRASREKANSLRRIMDDNRAEAEALFKRANKVWEGRDVERHDYDNYLSMGKELPADRAKLYPDMEAANATEQRGTPEGAAGEQDRGGNLPEAGTGREREVADFQSRIREGLVGDGSDAENTFWGGLDLKPASPEFQESPAIKAIRAKARAKGIDNVIVIADAPFESVLVNDNGKRSLVVAESVTRGSHLEVADHEVFHHDLESGDPKAQKFLDHINPKSQAFADYGETLNRLRESVGLEPLDEKSLAIEIAADASSGLTRRRAGDGKEIDLREAFHDFEKARNALVEYRGEEGLPGRMEPLAQEMPRPPTIRPLKRGDKVIVKDRWHGEFVGMQGYDVLVKMNHGVEKYTLRQTVVTDPVDGADVVTVGSKVINRQTGETGTVRDVRKPWSGKGDFMLEVRWNGKNARTDLNVKAEDITTKAHEAAKSEAEAAKDEFRHLRTAPENEATFKVGKRTLTQEPLFSLAEPKTLEEKGMAQLIKEGKLDPELKSIWEKIEKVKAEQKVWADENIKLAGENVSGVRLQSTTNPDKQILVHRSTYPDSRGRWQITYLDERGPSGHETADTLEAAIREASKAYDGSRNRNTFKVIDTAKTTSGTRFSLKPGEENQPYVISSEPVMSQKEFESELVKNRGALDKMLREPGSRLIPLYEGERYSGSRAGDKIKDAKGRLIELTPADLYERFFKPTKPQLPAGTETTGDQLLGKPGETTAPGVVEEPPSGYFGKLLRSVREKFSAANISEKADLAHSFIVKNLGWMAREMRKAVTVLEPFNDRFSKMSQEEMLRFTDMAESNSMAELTRMAFDPASDFDVSMLQAASAWRRMADGLHFLRSHINESLQEEARAAGKPVPDLETAYWENYFPRLFKNPEDAAAKIQALLKSRGRSLTGPESFENPRSQLLFSDSIKPVAEGGLGLEPLDGNYINMMKANVWEQLRFLTGKYIEGDLKEAGFLSKKEMTGWEKLKGDKTLEGYYAQPDVARVLDNFMSKGLRGDPLFELYNSPVTFINTVLVGLSAFHATFSVFSDLAHGVGSNLTRGIGAALTGRFSLAGHHMAELAKSAAVPLNLIKGGKFIEEYESPGTHAGEKYGETGTMGKIVDLMQKGGIRVNSEELSQVSRSFAEVLRDDKMGVPRKVVEMIAWPIMSYMVPRIKINATARLLQMELDTAARDGIKLTEQQQVKLAQDVARKSDNIFGQMVYDNLSMTRGLRDAMRILVGFPGWNIGSFTDILQAGKGIVHGVGEAGKAGAEFLTGRKPTWEAMSRQNRMSLEFYLGTVLTMAVFGAITQRLLTGEWPGDSKDLLMPKTGALMANGQAERIRPPTYMRDVLSLSHPIEMAKHKLNFPLRMFSALTDNQDFFGEQIRDPYSSAGTQVKDTAKYVGKSLLPFGIQGYLATESPQAKAMNLIGVTKVPRLYSNTPAMNVMDDYNKQNRAATTSKQAGEEKRLKSELRKLAGEKDEKGFRLAAATAMKEGTLTHQQIKSIVDESKEPTPGLGRFKALPVEWQVRAWNAASPEEQAAWKPIFLKKVMAAKPEILIRNKEALVPVLQDMGLGKAAKMVEGLAISDKKASSLDLSALGIRKPDNKMSSDSTIDNAISETIKEHLDKLGKEKERGFKRISLKEKKRPYSVLGF